MTKKSISANQATGEEFTEEFTEEDFIQGFSDMDTVAAEAASRNMDMKSYLELVGMTITEDRKIVPKPLLASQEGASFHPPPVVNVVPRQQSNTKLFN